MISKIYVNKKEFIANLILIISAIYLTIFSAISYYLLSFDKIYFLYLILICAFSDIGGYVFGKTFKGKKLTKISPNKTITGSVGSFILPLTLVPIFFYLLPEKFNDLFDLIILAIIVSFMCQLGDLFISYLKRKANVKDTGDLLPGHGGLLDRIDGIIFAVPFGMMLWEFLIVVI